MNTGSIPLKGEERVKKKPPKFIEKIIDKVEHALTKPASPQTKPKSFPQLNQLPDQTQQQPKNSRQMQVQRPVRGSSEFSLPEGTTIKLPNGQEFITNTVSKISKS